MNARFIRVAAGVCLFFGAVGAFAQSANTVRVSIPFDFIAGGQKLSAGDYLVEETGETGVGMLLIRGLNTKQSAMLLSGPADSRGLTLAQDASLTFERRGSDVYLTKVQPSGVPGRAIPAPVR